MVAHTGNPRTQEAETEDYCEFEASLGDRVSSRLAWHT